MTLQTLQDTINAPFVEQSAGRVPGYETHFQPLIYLVSNATLRVLLRISKTQGVIDYLRCLGGRIVWIGNGNRRRRDVVDLPFLHERQGWHQATCSEGSWNRPSRDRIWEVAFVAGIQKLLTLLLLLLIIWVRPCRLVCRAIKSCLARRRDARMPDDDTMSP